MIYIKKFESGSTKSEIEDIVESFVESINFEYLTWFVKETPRGFDIYINKDTKRLMPLNQFLRSIKTFENRINYFGYEIIDYKLITEKGAFKISKFCEEETIVQDIQSLSNCNIENIGDIISILITIKNK